MSESRRSSGHRSPLTAIESPQRQSAQNTSDPRTPMSRISAKVIFWGRAPEENVIRSLPKRSNEARTGKQQRANSVHTVETVTARRNAAERLGPAFRRNVLVVFLRVKTQLVVLCLSMEQRRGSHAENQYTGTTTAQSHSACGNACSPYAGSGVCSDHPFDESSAL